MNFIVSSATLLRHLQNISGVLNSSNTLPILDNFKFSIKGNELEISATDLETTMITKLEVQSEEDGAVAVPAKLVLEVLKSLPDQPCTFKVNGENHKVEISYDNGRSEMSGFNGAEFPKLPKIENQSTINISGEIVSNAINRTLFAAGNDELRAAMSGVYCEFSDNEIIFVATDAHKLVRYKRNDAKSTDSSDFILPKKPLNMLKANLSGKEDIKLEYNQSNAVFTFNELKLVCRLIDGKYPNYEAVIPKENPNVLTIDRLQLLNSIKRVSIFANKTTHQIKLKLVGSELSLSAEDTDFSNASNERLTCNYDGDDLEIGFNSRFIVEMLNNLDSDEVQLAMSEPSRAGILTPITKASENEDVLMLVMPVMLNR
jgi:DNA polymerase III subunit beta